MLLGDVGGFSGILFSAGAVIVSLFTHNNPQNYLTQRLFTQNDKSDSSTGGERKTKKLNPNKQNAFKEYLQETLPAMCATVCCLK